MVMVCRMRRRIAWIVWARTACIVEWCIWRNVSRSVGLIKSLERGMSTLLSGRIEVRSEELRCGIVRVVHAHHRVEAHWKSKNFYDDMREIRVWIVFLNRVWNQGGVQKILILSIFLRLNGKWPQYYCTNITTVIYLMTWESEGVGSPPTGGIPVLPRSRDIFYSLFKPGFEFELSVFLLVVFR